MTLKGWAWWWVLWCPVAGLVAGTAMASLLGSLTYVGWFGWVLWPLLWAAALVHNKAVVGVLTPVLREAVTR